jgi:uncharacterized protein YegJ (DUF2314 family)
MWAWIILAVAVVGVSLAVLMLWSSWRRNKREDAFASFVWLRRKVQRMSAHELALMVGAASGERLTHGPVPGINNVSQMPTESGPTMFVVPLTRAPLGVIVSGSPYVEDVEAAAGEAQDLRIRDALLAHKAWTAVDAMDNEGNEGAMSPAETARLLARIACEMADEDCLLLMVRPMGLGYPYCPAVLEALKSDDPMKALEEARLIPVIRVERDDEEMEAAEQEARARFGEFEASFASRDENLRFSVKSPFATDGEEREFIWIMVTDIKGGRIYGTLGNEPRNIPGRRQGDAVEVPVSELNDWVIFNERTQEMTGQFSKKALLKKK